MMIQFVPKEMIQFDTRNFANTLCKVKCFPRLTLQLCKHKFAIAKLNSFGGKTHNTTKRGKLTLQWSKRSLQTSAIYLYIAMLQSCKLCYFEKVTSLIRKII